jgi:glutathione reductase (NADPH)
VQRTAASPSHTHARTEQGLGIEQDSHGAIRVNELSQTNVPGVWAIGDVTNRINLTPVALMEGMAFAKTCFGGQPTKPDYQNVASAVFCQPPLASCGCDAVRVVWLDGDGAQLHTHALAVAAAVGSHHACTPALHPKPPPHTLSHKRRLTEEQAMKELSGPIDVYVSKFKPMKYTISGRDERTLMKLLVHTESDRVIGCHM